MGIQPAQKFNSTRLNFLYMSSFLINNSTVFKPSTGPQRLNSWSWKPLQIPRLWIILSWFLTLTHFEWTYNTIRSLRWSCTFLQEIKVTVFGNVITRFVNSQIWSTDKDLEFLICFEQTRLFFIWLWHFNRYCSLIWFDTTKRLLVLQNHIGKSQQIRRWWVLWNFVDLAIYPNFLFKRTNSGHSGTK